NNIDFSKGIIITTSAITKTAKEEIEQIRKKIPIDLITSEDFINSNIDWGKIDINNQNQTELPIQEKKKLREHQIEAVNNAKKYFKNPTNTRGKLIMACGTGKTFTSLKIAESITDKNGIIVFLAPSIALLGQTFREYCKEKIDPFLASIVCSDSKSGQSEDDTDPIELPYAPSTRYEDIIETYNKAKNNSQRFIIFSTYQSSYNIKKAQENGLPEIDLMICDEAHRTVGAMVNNTNKDSKEYLFGDVKDEELNGFVLCHKDENIKAKKRIYMTATPKVYTEKSKAKAKERDSEIFSMDDTEIYGDEIYSINFAEAVNKQLLTDYKVIILVLKSESLAEIANNAIVELKAENKELNHKLIDHNFVCKIIGTHKGLSKKDLVTLDIHNKEDKDFMNEMDKNPSRRAISFCRNIATSKNIKNSFGTIIRCYDKKLENDSFNNLNIYIDHIDGTMDAKIRLDKLTELDNPAENTCNVLSNARCLSEGIDVPALDTVIFFDGRNAMVDIIQAVGRVMRKAPDKETGYIILPIALTQDEIDNLDKAVQNTNFQNIWNILKALRSHDPSLVDEAVFREKIKIAISDNTSKETDPKKKDKKDSKNKDEEEGQYIFDLTTLQDIANSVYNVMPTKLGDKGYWESFSAKTAKIAETINIRLKDIFDKNPEILNVFWDSLKENIHSNIKEDEAIDMICSHIITKPIFDALFGDDSNKNPISNALDKIVDELQKLGLGREETTDLDKLYKNVKENAKLAKSQKSKQELIKNLYDTFLKTAFKKQSERLGVVYTPIEAVDFILHSINALLEKHFNQNFSSSNVKIFDPFTGTGSFIARLLSKDNNLIDDDSLENKYKNELFAQDIILLAYYIAMINISNAANERNSNLGGFKNIALADSLDYLEKKDYKNDVFDFAELKENKEIRRHILNEKINVILGNPPYFGGAKNQNDNNANIRHPILEEEIKNNYGKYSNAKLAKNTRDTLVQSIYIASKRLEDKGIIGFITNGSFIDSVSADGIRKSLYEEFSNIYIINLRGNQRTSGELSRKEGGKIFDAGSRASIAIIFLIKDKSKKERNIYYYDIGDYLSREDKLYKLKEFKNINNINFINIVPNEKNDWINKRMNSEVWEKYIKLRKINNSDNYVIFNINGCGSV
ncbi:restriction endonuclease, partial [Brachyspira hampsonii]|nr:restriction endonuclease [Brachyspira hampsonii]